jgi:periplasmic divalent cation tolerance protein
MADMRDGFRVVLTTADSAELAERLAHGLVERRLAACVNDDERLLLIKTASEQFEALREALRELHTYEVPEILALAVEAGDRPYLDWLAGCLGDG